MPYNPETEEFYQAPSTIVDSTPDGDTVQEGFDDRLTPAMAGVYTDLNLLKENGMIGVGIPATTTSRGISRVATEDEMRSNAPPENGPACLAAGTFQFTPTPTAHAVPQADASGKLDGWVSLAGKASTNLNNITSAANNVIKSAAAERTIKSTRTTTGDWTITGCKVGLPLDISADIVTSTTGGNNMATFRVTSGAAEGTGLGDGYFGLGRGSAWYSSNFFRCYPTSSTVVISVISINTVKLTARQ